MWRWLGNRLDWAALPVVVELQDVADVDLLVHLLIVIRDTDGPTT
ncbi:MAG: hypothetical protein ACOCUM_00310 [Thiohalospira sp.]